MTIDPRESFDVAVVGGGLAGLAAAACVARKGRRVVVFERSSALGGRAATDDEQGFRLNRGPHALYRAGAGRRVLRELGVRLGGGVPSVSGAYAVRDGRTHALPGGFVSLLTTGLLSLPAKLETARLLTSLPRLETAPLASVTVDDWLRAHVRHGAVRALLRALIRLATYADDPARQSAGSALAQVQLALAQNVVYLDGGWQTLVDGLREAAVGAGARVETRAPVAAIEQDGGVRAVRLVDGSRHPVSVAILATGPAEARTLVARGDETALGVWARDAVPVRAACLDVGLAHLPRPRALFALGIDRPLYLSVHSAVARLAPSGRAVVHVARYLGPGGGDDPAAAERELEALLDLVQPGWRAALVTRRMLPRMTVSHDLARATAGGTTGRPGPAVPDVRGLYVVGDWVGAEGLLADAALASARLAAELAAADGPRAAAA